MHEVRAEMSGRITEIMVDEGQMVAEGDEIAVLESMKSEIPVLTEIPGVVRELYVDRASVVREGDVIALIDES